MLEVYLHIQKLENAFGRELCNRETITYHGINIDCLVTHGCVELPAINSAIPAEIVDMVDFLCFKEKLNVPGNQWRHGYYMHRDTNDASAFFDSDSNGSRTLKLSAKNQADLIALREIVLRVEPGNHNRIDGLIEPPVDDWNAGYEAGLVANEALKLTFAERLEIAMVLLRSGTCAYEAIQTPFQRWAKTQQDPNAEGMFITWVTTVLLA